MRFLKLVCKISLIKRIFNNQYSIINIQLEKNVFGLTFKNPVGLGAGFDKNAKYLSELETLGFGCIEIGTVTPLPQQGNDKPRLFRLPKDKALINRMGFNNDGVTVVAKRLKEWKEKKEKNNPTPTESSVHVEPTNYKPQTTNHKLIVGGNIGKNKQTPNEDAWKDYEICFRELFEYVDYFVVNVSSPNTPGLRDLQQKDSLKKILTHLKQINAQQPKQKPLLLKISPDLVREELDDIIDLAMEIHLDGLVVANTTISREHLVTGLEKIERIGPGGLSGNPLTKRSTELITYISERSNKQIPIIASGGIFSAADAKEKFTAGAVLVQVWTGFIYEGPSIVKNICSDMVMPTGR